MKKAVMTFSLLLAFSMLLTACGKAPPKLIEIAAPAGVLQIEMDVGETTALELAKKFSPDEATEEQIAEAMVAANLTWVSDNLDAVEVTPDSGGGNATLKAKTAGTATVEVFGGTDDTTLLVTFSITVVIPLQSATMQEEITLNIKEEVFGSEQLIIDLRPKDATNVNVSFASDDETIATVDEKGIVTAVAVGETVIHAEIIGDFGTTGLSAINLETKVSVIVAPEEITLSTKEGWVYVGANVQLTPGTLPEEAKELTYTYTSSDPSIATVSTTGFITGKKVGTAVITVASEEAPNLTSTYTITIKAYANNSGGSVSNAIDGSGNAPVGGSGGTGGETSPTQPSNPGAPPAALPGSPENPVIGEPLDPGDTGNIGGE